jgi:hypothetical protein
MILPPAWIVFRPAGEVIRVGRLGKSEKEYRYAVRFVDLSSDILKKLRKFLKSLY